MEKPNRPHIIALAARGNHRDVFDSSEGLHVRGPFGGSSYDVRNRAVDESLPVVALYDRALVEGADFIAEAAARLRARGERIANFVVVPHGLYAENIVEGPDGNVLMVEAGYTKNAKGTTYVFDQPDKPLPVTMVDISTLHSVTMKELIKAGIPAVRSARQLEFGDKWMAKQRLQEFDIPTPHATWHSIEELKSGQAELPSKFVLKPRWGLGGMNVHLFKDGMDQERYDAALEEMGEYYDDALVEEYLDSLIIKHSSVEGRAAFNLRVIAYNGFCGAFARIHPEGVPGNVHGGAKMLSLPKLRQVLRHQHDINPSKLQDGIEESAYQVSAAFPNTLVGFDAMIDQQGETQVIEVNISDFGAFDPDPEAFSKRDWNESLERAARKISAIALSYPKPDTSSLDLETSRCIVDAPERWFHLLEDQGNKDRYHSEEHGFNDKKFLRNNRTMIDNLYEAFEARRIAGEFQHCESIFATLLNIAEGAGHRTLTKKFEESLARLATYKAPSQETTTSAE